MSELTSLDDLVEAMKAHLPTIKGDAMGSYKDYFAKNKAIKAADLTEPFLATIQSVSEVEFPAKNGAPAETGLHLHFSDDSRVVALNKTRCEAISNIAGGDDMDAWGGTQIVVYQGQTMYAGNTVACIAVRAPKQMKAKPELEEIPF